MEDIENMQRMRIEKRYDVRKERIKGEGKNGNSRSTRIIGSDLNMKVNQTMSKGSVVDRYHIKFESPFEGRGGPYPRVRTQGPFPVQKW